MDFKSLRNELEKSKNIFTEIEKEHQEQVQEEVRALDALVSYLAPALPHEYINGKRATLIYVYEDSNKKTISNRVYYCEDKMIRYQVFKKEDYLNYNPTVVFDGAYALVEPKEHLSKRNGLELADIVDFFAERIDTLREIGKQLHEEVEARRQYLKAFKSISKNFL
ncbi:hypothetical protein U8V72_19755 [Priestia filamentosa]|uniref:hypothetical protein n=1 Tax=Priestia filamentosa TaxID=1402861 RepID=UPI0005890D91